MNGPLDNLPIAIASVCARLRDELIIILAEDLVALWVFGACVFPDSPVRLGDIDTYGILARPVIRDMSFRIESGQMAALVGPSGAGKTSITYLLSRLYDPTEGAILLDGVDLQDIKLNSLRSHFGMALQEPFLFHTTI